MSTVTRNRQRSRYNFLPKRQQEKHRLFTRKSSQNSLCFSFLFPVGNFYKTIQTVDDLLAESEVHTTSQLKFPNAFPQHSKVILGISTYFPILGVKIQKYKIALWFFTWFIFQFVLFQIWNLKIMTQRFHCFLTCCHHLLLNSKCPERLLSWRITSILQRLKEKNCALSSSERQQLPWRPSPPTQRKKVHCHQTKQQPGSYPRADQYHVRGGGQWGQGRG